MRVLSPLRTARTNVVRVAAEPPPKDINLGFGAEAAASAPGLIPQRFVHLKCQAALPSAPSLCLIWRRRSCWATESSATSSTELHLRASIKLDPIAAWSSAVGSRSTTSTPLCESIWTWRLSCSAAAPKSNRSVRSSGFVPPFQVREVSELKQITTSRSMPCRRSRLQNE